MQTQTGLAIHFTLKSLNELISSSDQEYSQENNILNFCMNFKVCHLFFSGSSITESGSEIWMSL